MAQLIDLLHGLTEVLIRYHDHYTRPHFVSTSHPDPDNAYKERSKSISQSRDLSETLEKIIKDILKQAPDKKQLLTYLEENILFLNTLVVREASISDEQLEQDKKTLTNMVTEIKQLILTPKASSCTITIISNDSKIPIPGSLQCESGMQLERFLKKFTLSKKSTEEEINKTISELCDNHQNTFLVSELKQEIERLINKSTSEAEKAAQQMELIKETLNNHLKELEHEVQALKLENAALQTSIDEQAATLEAAHTQISELIAHNNPSKQALKPKHRRAPASIAEPESIEKTAALNTSGNIMGLRGLGGFYYHPGLFPRTDTSIPTSTATQSSEGTATASQGYYPSYSDW